MIPITVEKVIMVHDHVDFRKQWNGLLALARGLGHDPYDRNMVVFVKRDKSQLRAICGDDKGLFLLSRRFEGGSLNLSFDGAKKQISLAELCLWFEGVHFTVIKKVKKWR